MPESTDRITTLRRLRARLSDLRATALAAERAEAGRLSRVHPEHRASAVNLLHYRALRLHDLRELQAELSAHGLSSLGRMEARVLPNLNAVIGVLDELLDGTRPEPANGQPGAGRLRENAARLFGGEPDSRHTRIMVTLPSEAAHDPDFSAALALTDMDAVRINCAHDDAEAWRAMAGHVRAVKPQTVVAMDLAGPKLRTGPIEPGPAVLKIKPERDELGRVLAPARLWLGEPSADAEDVPAVPVEDPEALAGFAPGAQVCFREARGRRRVMRVASSRPGGILLEGDRTSYLVPGTELTTGEARAHIGALPPVPRFLRVFPGDRITLTAELEPAPAGTRGSHIIGCTLPEVFEAVRPGHRIAFDDGKIEGLVDTAGPGELVALITDAALSGTKLREAKGINLPDTSLPVTALTEDDREAMGTVAEIADVVQLSFVRSAEDVAALIELLEQKGAGDLGVVVKIETVEGFRALPEILLELMRIPRIGVMIARGDLAVEAGFERLAEVQEEILWLCEAAHVPAIWATQVLDSLADDGLPTRAEVTDAAAGKRAECVMLNKGPHIVEAIDALDDILQRMSGHVDKKTSLLRRLGAWETEA